LKRKVDHMGRITSEIESEEALGIGRLKEIGLSGISALPDRMRVLRPEVVAVIAKSFKEIGQKQPIVIRPNQAWGYYLVAGWHRLEAARKLKWETISSLVVDGLDVDKALLIEIDENLARAELSPVERVAHEEKKKEIHDRSPQVFTHGGNRRWSLDKNNSSGSSGQFGHLNVSNNSHKASVQSEPLKDPYFKAAAKETGRGERTIRRDTFRGENLRDVTDNVIGLARTSLDKGVELDALAQLSRQNPELAKEVIEKAVLGEKVSARHELKKFKRDEREADLGQRIVALPTKKYGVIVEDFEWDHVTWSEKGKDRHAGNHYPTSRDAHTAEEILERTRGRFECAADDCVLFMWTTTPHLAVAIELMRLRGFKYSTNFVWAKDRIGTGYWSRNKHELLLVGRRGDVPAPAHGTQYPSLIEAPVGEHSAKPEVFLEMIESYFPSLPKIELNRRGSPRPGWDAWGNEVEDAA
jgi:N6-adenosine-specific RNA methylase IME4/uncharacterized ParB-like nuclease family protein